jgi:hypothetical protein
LDDETIEIGFQKGSFYLDKMSEEGNKGECEEICRNYFKKDLKVVFKDVTGSMSNSGAKRENSQEPTDQERALRKEAMENPVIQETVKIFGGTIEEIKMGKGVKP